MSHGIPENRIVCQTGKHVVPFRLDFVSISDRKDRAIELTESKFYIKSRRQFESEREGTRRFEAPINEDRGDAEWRERMVHWEGEPLSQWMNRPSREKANVWMEHRNSTKMRLGARPPELCLSLWSGANNLRIRFGKSFDRSISRYWYSRNQTARLVAFRLLGTVNTRCIYMWNFRGGRERRRRSNQCFFRPSRFNREYSLVSRRSGGRAWKKNYCSREISLSVARAKDAEGSFGRKEINDVITHIPITNDPESFHWIGSRIITERVDFKATNGR